MWILFTTSNDPNAWVPAYSTSRISAVFFIIFLVITIYLLLSLLLAKIYQTYQAILRARMEEFSACQAESIREAFETLADRRPGEAPSIDTAVWSEFLMACCHPLIGKITCSDDSPESAEYTKERIFAILSRYVPDITEYTADAGSGMDFKLFKQTIHVFLEAGMYIQSKAEKEHNVDWRSYFSPRDRCDSESEPLRRFDNPTASISRSARSQRLTGDDW
eukprot:CAMPEP_0169421802 /NCGR_PEP_ID=MMETSP1017-20121227/66514_1 /TAXON_ID=342587 /ORGANISM="Karlodinium micrum, Strain CCMP2283" /LENGTH=219 /DNA_ID=CAMNT_0009531169 /DNA_START=475 /DNA_END=1131 /DNA_ORIENTATION=+